MSENNFSLTGDEARFMMLVLANSNVTATSSSIINLWIRLSQISQVQPPIVNPNEETND